MFSGEATKTKFIVFGLTGSGIVPTIYSTRGKHANHYFIDAVPLQWETYNYTTASAQTFHIIFSGFGCKLREELITQNK
jgi:hypothetical protein